MLLLVVVLTVLLRKVGGDVSWLPCVHEPYLVRPGHFEYSLEIVPVRTCSGPKLRPQTGTPSFILSTFPAAVAWPAVITAYSYHGCEQVGPGADGVKTLARRRAAGRRPVE